MKRIFFTGVVVALIQSAVAAPTPQKLSDNKIKIGVLNDMSGPYADMSGKGSLIAAQMAVDDFKKENPKANIEIVSADHQNKTDVAVNIASKWFDVDGVDMIVDLPNSAVALAVQEVAKKKDKIDIVVAAATSDLTGKGCSKTGFHWAFDAYAVANSTASAVTQAGDKTWFILTADYNFGHSMEKEARAAIESRGGKVLESVSHPFPGTDFSSYLLKAASSPAKVVGLANAGADTINSIKQANEFGITKKKKLAAFVVFLTDIHSLGLKVAQKLVFTDGFYWDLDNETRAFATRFSEKMGGGSKPTMVHAGTYSAVMHYLKSVYAAGTDKTDTVVAKMKSLPVKDFFAKNGSIREDGRMVHDMYLVQVKTPEESKGPWDLYKILKTIPGKEAFKPLKDSECDFIKK